jgi:hypothetical protein
MRKENKQQLSFKYNKCAKWEHLLKWPVDHQWTVRDVHAMNRDEYDGTQTNIV